MQPGPQVLLETWFLAGCYRGVFLTSCCSNAMVMLCNSVQTDLSQETGSRL